MPEMTNIIEAVEKAIQSQKERIELLEWERKNLLEENARLKKQIEAKEGAQ